MIELLLPSPVATAEAYADVSGASFPEELAAVAYAVESRRREFLTVRHCARQALARLGDYPAAPITSTPRGAPRWPAGVVGSMTHTAGYRAAAVARADDIRSIGIDAELHEALDPAVLEAVTVPEERALLADLAASRPGTAWDRILFSAKESVYKAWFPLTGRMLEFEDATVDIDPLTARFRARLLVPAPASAGAGLHEFGGRWLADAGLVVTAVALPTAVADQGAADQGAVGARSERSAS